MVVCSYDKTKRFRYLFLKGNQGNHDIGSNAFIEMNKQEA